MTYQERMDFYPPVDREDICFYCDKVKTDDLDVQPYELNMLYRPRMKDVSKGISPAGSFASFIYVPFCGECFHKLDVKCDLENFQVTGWDWWDAVDGLPDLD